MSFVLQLKFSLNHIIRNHVAMIIALGGGGGGMGIKCNSPKQI